MMDKERLSTIRDLYNRHQDACLKKLKDMAYSKHTTMGNYTHKFIAIVRDQSRACNKEALEKSIPMKEDGFIVLFKKQSKKLNWTDDLKRAMEYL